MSQNYVPAAKDLKAFHCPRCGTYAKQLWYDTGCRSSNHGSFNLNDISVSVCQMCEEVTIWIQDRMLHPTGGSAPLPHPELPKDCMKDFEEARSIVTLSPRGACALLRLVLQKLCKHLGGKGKDINVDIGEMCKKGLPERVWKALDVIRIVGNNSVHPGEIDLQDDVDMAIKMFNYINVVCDIMIAQPKEVEQMFNNVTNSNQREAIEKRNTPKP